MDNDEGESVLRKFNLATAQSPSPAPRSADLEWMRIDLLLIN